MLSIKRALSKSQILFICSMLIALSSPAIASPDIPGFEPGIYLPQKSLAEGAKDMCDDSPVRVSLMRLPEGRWAVKLDGRHSYFVPTTAGTSRIKSDIDAKCVFVEESAYSRQGPRTTLSKTDSEICENGRRIGFSDLTTMTFEEKRITLQVTDKLGQAPSYTCVYIKK